MTDPAAPEPSAAVGSPQADAPAASNAPTLAIPVRIELRPEQPSERTEPAAREAAGRYLVEEEIGRGGMAVVYRAFDRDIRRHVAMKVMIGDLEMHAELKARFVEEAQATGQLQHPGIVPIYEIGADARGRLFFTMKLVRGRTLAKVVEQARAGGSGTSGEFTRFRLLQVFVEVARAVGYAHDRGIMHRDLKPQNVMIGAHGEIHVMDWGLAKAIAEVGSRRRSDSGEGVVEVERSREETQAGALVGTPAYMAPEQAEGVAAIGPRADVYALGATLYHLLTGRPPFDGGSPTEIIAKVLEDEPVRPRAIDPSVPREVEAICLKALAKDPAARYESASALAEDVQNHLQGLSVAAYPEGPLGRAARWAKRHRAVTATVAVATLIGFVGAVAGVVVLGRAIAAEHLAQLRGLEQRERAERERAIAEDRLAEVLRLADVKRLADYEQAAEALWPAVPEKAPAMKAWLEGGRALVGRLPLHRAKLAELEGKALPAAAGPGPSAGGGRTFRFADDEARWEHDTLTGLVRGIERFAAESATVGAIASVETRLKSAETIHARSIDEHREKWAAVTAAIGDPARCPQYHGLKVTPQLGLVPIGQDPQSHLFEFAHLETGEPPERGPDGRLLLREETGIVFVLLPGGKFRMGAVRPEQAVPGETNIDPAAEPHEGPVHDHAVAPFFLSKYEMTQGQWLRLAGKNPSFHPSGGAVGGKVVTLLHPVELVSHDDATELLRRLGLRLPAEAEWEYAARAGTTTVYYTGNDERSLEGAVNIADRFGKRNGGSGWPTWEDWLDDGYTVHAPVGSFRPNAFGLHDMLGNVWEWCADGGDSDAYARYARGDMTPPDGGPNRAYGGGSWRLGAEACRSALRSGALASYRDDRLGCRPALDRR